MSGIGSVVKQMKKLEDEREFSRIDDASNIVTIQIFKRRQTYQDWTWKDQWKRWWGKVMPEGYYIDYGFAFGYAYQSVQELLDMGLLIEGRSIYIKPFVEVIFSNRQQGSTRVEFNTYNECLAWAMELATKHIKVQLIT